LVLNLAEKERLDGGTEIQARRDGHWKAGRARLREKIPYAHYAPEDETSDELEEGR